MKKNNCEFVERDGLLYICTSCGDVAVVDNTPEIVEKVKAHSWYPHRKGYLHCKINGEHVALHNFVTDCPDGMVVDHINHNTFDNRLVNLRVCTPKQNSYNRSYKDGRVVGVKKIHETGKYKATIRKDGVAYNLGEFDTFRSAYSARYLAEYEMFGEFGPNVSKVIADSYGRVI